MGPHVWALLDPAEKAEELAKWEREKNDRKTAGSSGEPPQVVLPPPANRDREPDTPKPEAKPKLLHGRIVAGYDKSGYPVDEFGFRIRKDTKRPPGIAPYI